MIIFFLIIFSGSAGTGWADEGSAAYGKAWKAVEAERFEEALDLFTEAAEAAPENGTYRRFVGWVLYSKLNRHQEALPHLRQAGNMIPEETGVHLDLGLVTGKLKLYDEMFDAYEKAFALYRNRGEPPPDWAVQNCASTALFALDPPDIGLGKHYLSLADNFGLEETVTEKIHSWISAAYQNTGWNANKEGRREDALQAFKEGYEFDPENEGNISGYGYILRELKRADDSAAVLTRGLRLFPDSEGIQTQYMYTLQSLAWQADSNGNTEEALSLFREAYGIDPDNQWNINGYGAFLNKSGAHLQAIGILERGIELHPENEYIPGNLVHACLTLAGQMWNAGNLYEADGYYQKAALLDPDNFWVWLNLYYKHRSVARDDAGELGERVLSLISPARISEYPDEVKAFYANYGEYLFSDQRISDARSFLHRALEIFPDDPNLYSSLAGTYFRIDMDMWRRLAEKALDMVPGEERTALGTYRLPMRGRVRVHQGNHGGISHLGPSNGYAWDFVLVDDRGELWTDWERKEAHYVFGADVYAAGPGEVIYVHDTDPDTEPGKNDPRYNGNVISIRHANGEVSHYIHLLQGSSLVQVGDRVAEGQPIGKVGASGKYVDFPHLHFQINRDGHSVEAKLTGFRLSNGTGGWTDPGPYTPLEGDVLQIPR